MLAARVRAHQAEIEAQEIDQMLARLDAARHRFAVDRQGDVDRRRSCCRSPASHLSLARLSQRALQHDAGQMLLHGGAAVLIGIWRQFRAQRRPWRPRSRRASAHAHQAPRPRAVQAPPYRPSPKNARRVSLVAVPGNNAAHGNAGHGIVAVAARDFIQRRSLIRLARRKRDGRDQIIIGRAPFQAGR